MKLLSLYNQIVKFGREYDPRPKAQIRSFEDSSILYGDPGLEVRRIMVGIDIDAGELLLADRIRSRRGLDLVISHHPAGKSLAALYQVMQLQVDLMTKAGIARNVAQQLLDERRREIARRFSAHNHMRSVDAARLLGMPFMCVHTPADNHVAWYLESLLRKEKPRTLEDIMELLLDIPEYKKAAREGCGPEILRGSPKRQAGKVFVEMTGGTEGPREAYPRLYKAGIRTLVSMHLGEEHFSKVKDVHLNVIIAGHISSDTLGLNLLLDRVERSAGKAFEVAECSGFTRVKRS